MSILQELIDYSHDCINDIIPSCQKHKWACQRFLNDLEKSKSRKALSEPFPYVWNEEEAQSIVDWFAMLRHSKGVLAGKPIVLTTAQKFSICQIFGWRHEETGFKRFTTTFKELGRKNAKSQEEAGIILYCISVEATAMGEIYETYCAGVKREQSGIIFNECKNLLKGSPLKRKFKITRNMIEHIKTGSFLKPLTKEDGKSGDGTNPALLVLDEYHQHPDTNFYDLGIGGNTKQSLLMIITTAGVDLNAPCFTQEYKYVSQLLNPDVDIHNDSYFADIHEAEEGDDLSDIRTWQKANPIRAYYDDGVQKIRELYEIAKSIPEKIIAFKTKVLNIWVQAKENGYMNMAKWKRCEVAELPYDITGLPVYVGFDMSAKIDLTSVSFIIPIQDGEKVKYILFSHSFIPNRQKLMERVSVDKAPYDAWEEQGYITITDSEVVDQNVVMAYVKEFVQKYKLDVQCLCFDPNNASKLMIDLSNEGYICEEVYQSYRSLNEATAGFREEVYEKNIIYIFNPVLNYAMANAVIRRSDGLIKIDKDATKQRIDPVDATLCAYKLARYHDFDYNSNMSDEWLEGDEW